MELGRFDAVVIATDSRRVVEVCRGFGAEVVSTDPGHRSGTDRVAEVAADPRWSDPAVIVNLQGDEPLVGADAIDGAVGQVLEGWEVGTCATRIRSGAELSDPAVVKVVLGSDGGALYFSRAPVPWRRDPVPPGSSAVDGPFLRHIGLYAFRREALTRWTSLPPSALEAVEQLEQLRALEAGMRIGVAQVEAAEGGVDTLEDAVRMEARLKDVHTIPSGEGTR